MNKNEIKKEYYDEFKTIIKKAGYSVRDDLQYMDISERVPGRILFYVANKSYFKIVCDIPICWISQ